MNVRLVDSEKRDYFLECVKEGVGLDVCAVVDTGLSKAGNVAMEQVAARKGMVWVGKGRKRRSGGMGFLVVGEWKIEVLKWVVDSVGWIQVSSKVEKLVVGAVYRAPSMNLGDVLAGITGDVMRYRGRGTMVLVGDFNCRVGELPNRVLVEGEEETREIRRKSEDKRVTSEGKQFMEWVRGLNLMVLNGHGVKAMPTSQQVKGSSVIDLVCVEYEAVSRIEEVRVWDDDIVADLSDHRLVTVDVKGGGENRESEARLDGGGVVGPERSGEAGPRRKVWKRRDRGDEKHWDGFVKGCDVELKEWCMEVRDVGDVEGAWEGWVGRVERVAEDKIGEWRRGEAKARRERKDEGEERQKWELVQKRNEVRRLRDRARGHEREEWQEKLKMLKSEIRRVKQGSVRLEVEGVSEEIEKEVSKDPKVYWKKINGGAAQG